MPPRLRALFADLELPLSNQPTVLGRSRQLHIASTAISRHACSCYQEGQAQARLVAHKVVYVKRQEGKATVQISKDESCKLSIGDAIYLAKEASEYQYGFELLREEVSAAMAPAPAVLKGKHNMEDEEAAGNKGCFDGVHITFWTRSHTATLKQKAVQADAILEGSISANTKLVIAARDTSAVDAAAGLANLPPCIPCLSKKWEGQKLKIPTNIDLVVPEYVSDCLVQGRLLPTSAYLIALQQVASKDSRTYSNEECKVSTHDAAEVSQLPKPGSAVQQQSPADSITQPQAKPAEATDYATAEPSDVGSAVTPTSGDLNLLPARQKHQARPLIPPATGMQEAAEPSGEKKLGIYPDISPEGRAFTGGHTSVPWGTGGVWEEPWDQKRAMHTIQTIERHWYQTDGASTGAGPLIDAHEGPDDDHDEGSEGEEEPPRKQLKASVNTVCDHVACSAQTVCLVEQMQIVRDNYRGRIDQFRIKAAERAIGELTRLDKPLQTEQDVAELSMGAKSKDKVLEIMQTGTLRSIEMLAKDEQQQVIQLFLKVWGAAEATCQRWYNAGCRTLDDLRARDDLTEQQVAGLKHFDDMQQRIPRSEVQQVHKVVCEAVRQVLGIEDSSDADRLHCRVTGSYIRGKPMTGDIDFLIMPPASREPVACGAVLQALLAHLLQQGLLLDEMNPGRTRPRETGSATWLGLCKPAGSPYVRRIDFKVYPARYTAFAVNYFIGSGPFVRALRYWARTATKSLAQQVAPSATGFKLTDTVLVPLIMQPKQRLEKGQVRSADILVPPGIHCDDETEIFEKLGLAYVPPFMRYFGSNYQ